MRVHESHRIAVDDQKMISDCGHDDQKIVDTSDILD